MCIIWDICRLKYVATLKHDSPVRAVCVSPVSGRIVTVETRQSHGRAASRLHLWSVNAEHLAQVDTRVPVTAVQATSHPICVIPNAVVAGCADGSLEIYDSSSLAPVMAIGSQEASCPITVIRISEDNKHVFTGDIQGNVVDWAFGDGNNELDL